MSDRRRLGEEIIDHLRFYQGIGGKWVVRRASRPAPQSRAAAPPPSAAPPPPPRAVVVPPATMFAEPERPQESLEDIRNDLGDCPRCKLAGTRRNIVFGSGNPAAELMLVGEAPGADEDEQGLPFVGRAGQLLTRILEAIDLRRDAVYICNILKCRPPGNRNPEKDEIAACEEFLFRQIAAVRPKVICALGLFGVQTLLRTKAPISALRGRFYDYRGVKLMPTFHPAYLLRNPNEKRRVWEDMRMIRDYLRGLRQA